MATDLETQLRDSAKRARGSAAMLFFADRANSMAEDVVLITDRMNRQFRHDGVVRTDVDATVIVKLTDDYRIPRML